MSGIIWRTVGATLVPLAPREGQYPFLHSTTRRANAYLIPVADEEPLVLNNDKH